MTTSFSAPWTRLNTVWLEVRESYPSWDLQTSKTTSLEWRTATQGRQIKLATFLKGWSNGDPPAAVNCAFHLSPTVQTRSSWRPKMSPGWTFQCESPCRTMLSWWLWTSSVPPHVAQKTYQCLSSLHLKLKMLHHVCFRDMSHQLMNNYNNNRLVIVQNISGRCEYNLLT